jgi:Tfp pilus assembly protein PilP
MKLTTGIVALALTTGTAWAQNPNLISHTKAELQGAAQKKTADINAALGGQTTAKPAPAKPVAGEPTGSAAPAPAKAPVPAKATAPAKLQTAAPKAAAPRRDPMAKPVAAVAAKPQAQGGKAAKESKDNNPEDRKYAMTGKRDPFVSPVVSRQGGSGCSTGKKCLDIEQLAVRGVVRSDVGMIAVVTNGLNKAYFLRENDPVFNGYVVKITGDSVVFKETFQDRLGKPFTKDVVKKITTPAV